MEERFRHPFGRAARPCYIVVLSTAVLWLCLAVAAFGSDLTVYSLCDVRVLYLFDDAEAIDWPTLYYLNGGLGCRVDLVSVTPREQFMACHRRITDREIFLHQYYFPENDPDGIDSLVTELCHERRPDIVLLDDASGSRLFIAVAEYLSGLVPSPDRLFSVRKIYRRTHAAAQRGAESGMVTLNGNELLNRYRQRMESEIPTLFRRYWVQNLTSGKLVSYTLVKSSLPQESRGADFLSGINLLRITDILDQWLAEGPRKQTLLKHASDFVSSFKASQQAVGRARVGLIVEGYRRLLALTTYTDFGPDLESLVDFKPYLRNLGRRAERAALQAVGLVWEGKIIVRDSPHGPRLKFLASLSANGPKEVELSAIRFHPYWDTTAVVLDSVSRTIAPHQSYVREYLIDIDQSHLEAQRAESLLFTAAIAYGKVPLVFSSSLPVWEAPDLKVRFEPDYYFVQPLGGLDIDRVVSSMALRVVISKPRYYSAMVRLDLEAPRGLFAGAYRQEIQLDKGATYETIRIPFSVSNLFELGVQPLYLTLTAEGEVVTADTARVRIAACQVADTVKIGFMPDSTGMLEDILRMTDAGFQPITDRSLVTANLNAFNVILVGSGSFRQYPSFRKVKDRFEDYVRHGGSIVVMGQPDDWPQGALPVSLAPMTEMVEATGIVNRVPEARILSRPYDISEKNLLSSFYKKRVVTSALVSPAEQVYVSPSGASLLSISRLGEGQIIYCGLPLLEMVSGLKIDAIHLLANILNY